MALYHCVKWLRSHLRASWIFIPRNSDLGHLKNIQFIYVCVFEPRRETTHSLPDSITFPLRITSSCRSRLMFDCWRLNVWMTSFQQFSVYISQRWLESTQSCVTDDSIKRNRSTVSFFFFFEKAKLNTQLMEKTMAGTHAISQGPTVYHAFCVDLSFLNNFL